jgi:hypothetical protein
MQDIGKIASRTGRQVRKEGKTGMQGIQEGN